MDRYPASAREQRPDICSKCLYWLYLSHFSTDWAEILHDSYLSGKDEVCRQNIDPAAMQYSMQRCRIFKHCTAYISAIPQQIELKFCVITLEVKRIDSSDKTGTLQHCSIPCSAAESLIFIQPLAWSFLIDWGAEFWCDYSLSGKDQV